MKDTFEEVINRTLYIGVDEIAYPIDVFQAATALSSHPDAGNNVELMFPLISDVENQFTRWAAIRAVNQMGPLVIRRAKKVLSAQLEIECYSLAKKEIEDALVKLDELTT